MVLDRADQVLRLEGPELDQDGAQAQPGADALGGLQELAASWYWTRTETWLFTL